MVGTVSEPTTTERSVLRTFTRVVGGAILVAIVFAGLLGFVEYQAHQREYRIARKIESLGGDVFSEKWGRFPPPFASGGRFKTVELFGRPATADVLAEVGSLSNLKELFLDGSQVEDASLKHLAGLTQLQRLTLRETPITDVGLEHLKGLKSLKQLDLRRTRTTPQGRAMLQQALPGCVIESSR